MGWTPSDDALKKQKQQEDNRKNRDELEGKRQKKVLDYLNAQPQCMAWLSKNIGGEADIHSTYHGLYLAIETKRPGEELTALQEQERVDVIATGGFSFRAESVEDVKVILETIDDVIPEGTYE